MKKLRELRFNDIFIAKKYYPMHQTTFVEVRAQEKVKPQLICKNKNKKCKKSLEKTQKSFVVSFTKKKRPDFNNNIVWRRNIDQQR